jgi:hypothetical protein
MKIPNPEGVDQYSTQGYSWFAPLGARGRGAVYVKQRNSSRLAPGGQAAT